MNIERGIVLARKNAFSLLEDAKTLLQAQSHGRAVALSLIAFEEYAKVILLTGVRKGVTQLDTELNRIIFRDHLGKLAATLHLLAIAQGREEKEEVSRYVNETVRKLQDAKERGLYVDFFSEEWHSPLDPEMRQVAGKMVEDTERFILQIDEWLRPIDQP
jgi:AbiV family abortive infection protein